MEAPDLLARRLARIGIVAAERGAALQAGLAPGQRLVSREGHLWRWDGYCSQPADAPSEAALRLEQRNRAEALTRQIGETEARAEAAAERHDAAKARLEQLAEADRARAGGPPGRRPRR